ncbi:hypothetical protein E2C01_050783 [Portunus trituberculatus]|uniref:Uncharacterized protein n=1 Tax=Portunus trituberculatus TaxID=210409 RepID=A0A5B7GHV0_PORTR|nr:hypothetical protein [Portunus trituberculatus]
MEQTSTKSRHQDVRKIYILSATVSTPPPQSTSPPIIIRDSVVCVPAPPLPSGAITQQGSSCLQWLMSPCRRRDGGDGGSLTHLTSSGVPESLARHRRTDPTPRHAYKDSQRECFLLP